jgi:hypothetical protein
MRTSPPGGAVARWRSPSPTVVKEHTHVMETIRFVFTAIPTSSFVVVNGGADADKDNTIEDNGEQGAFTRFGNTWTRQQDVLSPLRGTLWGVAIGIGVGVAWTLQILDKNNTVLHSDHGTTTIAVDELVGRLP